MLYLLLFFLITVQINAMDLPFVDNPVNIDGYIEDTWNNAYKIDTSWTQASPNFGELFDDSCHVYLMYNSYNLFVFFKVFQDTSKLTALNGIRDQIGSRDEISLIIDPLGNKQEAYFIQIGLPNVIVDFRQSRYNRNIDFSWNSNAEYAVTITDYGYNIEIRIPFSDFRRKHKNMIWNLNFYRKNIYNNSAATLFPQKDETFESRYESLKPFSLPKAAFKREKLEIMPYSFYGTNFNDDIKNAGFDIRLPVKTNSVFNFAFNPDFNQLEGDPITIDFNSRYALYYREYRPFFTEEKNVFYTENEIFYSRAIQNPYLAGKYTYKDESNQFGLIFANDKYDSLMNNENRINAILRYSKQFNKNSFGIYVINSYNIDSISNNTVFSHDGNIYINDFNISYNTASSAIKNDVNYKNYFAKLNINYAIQDFSINLKSEAISQNFFNTLAYITEYNKLSNEMEISKTVKFNNRFINFITLNGDFELSENIDNIENISLSRDSLSHTEYEAQTKLVFGNYNYAVFSGLIYTYNQIYYNSSFLLTNTFSSFLHTRFNKYFSINSYISHGGGVDYLYTRVGKNTYMHFGFNYTPFAFLQFENTFSYSIFQTDTLNTITDYSLLKNTSTIWKTFYMTNSLKITPNNSYSLKFVFRISYIDFAQNYYPSYFYINNMPDNIINKDYQLFALFTYRPSLNNAIYLGIKYLFENQNQIRNINKEKLFFFKFTHKFFI